MFKSLQKLSMLQTLRLDAEHTGQLVSWIEAVDDPSSRADKFAELLGSRIALKCPPLSYENCKKLIPLLKKINLAEFTKFDANNGRETMMLISLVKLEQKLSRLEEKDRNRLGGEVLEAFANSGLLFRGDKELLMDQLMLIKQVMQEVAKYYRIYVSRNDAEPE